MMDNKRFFSKILLFGEYGIMSNSDAISLPFKEFYGYLNKSESIDYKTKISNSKLIELYQFILNSDAKDLISIQDFKNDLDTGLHFVSNIPISSGLGSSGALVASIFDKYRKKNSIDFQIEEIKNLLSIIESKFHGKSSGLDPLVSFLNKPLLYSNQKIKLLDQIIYNDFKVFIIDSQINSSTKKMIKIFQEKMNNLEFKNFFTNQFIKNNNDCINNLRVNPSLFKGSIKQLSEITFDNFQEMIPNNIKSIWEKGLKNNSYYIKLCGSGGGGFFLLFDFENRVNYDFSEFTLFEI